MTRLLGILGLAAFLLVPASAHGQCVNCVEGDCNTAAAVDTTLREDCDSVADAVARGIYDFRAGRVRAEASGCYTDGPWGTYIDVYASDRFHLTGPSGGGPVEFVARLTVFGGVTQHFNIGVRAALHEIGGDSVIGYDDGVVLDKVLSLTLRHAVGEEFVLRSDANAGTFGGTGSHAFVEGILSFANLPPGYGIVSCQNYSGGITPALPTTWGALKLRYR